MKIPARAAAAAGWPATAATYVLMACGITWPLPKYLRSHLLGDPSGDMGVYVWNLWIFRHELLEHHHLPFSTDHVFAYTGGADFSLHNYTPIAGALGAPLIGVLGVVGAFNVVMLACIAMSGLGMYLLARRVGLGAVPAWCAGALFMASPVLVAKETAHLSLAAAAPLPLFLWALLRTLDAPRIRGAVLVGAITAAAFYSDAYYGIYCGLMGAFIISWQCTHVEWQGRTLASSRHARVLDVVLAVALALIAWRLLSGTAQIVVGSLTIGLQTFYTPALCLLLLIGARLWLEWHPRLRLAATTAYLRQMCVLGLVAVGVCVVLLLPELVGLAIRWAQDRLPGTETYWRSSPRGVDLLAYAVPNPNHPWFGSVTRLWLMPDLADAFPEFVSSFSLVALLVIGVAWWRGLLPRVWVAFTLFFAALSAGPFLYVGGIATQVVGPWALLRYVPVIGMARSPTRFAVVAVLGLSLLSVFALQALHRGWPRTRWLTGLIAVALVLEMLPMPRHLYAAAVPDVYRLITTAGDESGRLLELPTGIRDGTSSFGNFNAAAQYFQTGHHRPLIGGYLSRVSRRRWRENRQVPMLRALYSLSEGHPLSPEWKAEAYRSRTRFLRRSCVRFVVVNKAKASLDLQEFARDALGLMLVHEDATHELLTPTDPPPCDAARRSVARRDTVLPAVNSEEVILHPTKKRP